jgi:hypothetical protein
MGKIRSVDNAVAGHIRAARAAAVGTSVLGEESPENDERRGSDQATNHSGPSILEGNRHTFTKWRLYNHRPIIEAISGATRQSGNNLWLHSARLSRDSPRPQVFRLDKHRVISQQRACFPLAPVSSSR